MIFQINKKIFLKFIITLKTNFETIPACMI